MEENIQNKEMANMENESNLKCIELEKKIKDLELALQEKNNQFLYLKADIDNLRKNSFKEIEQQVTYKMNKYSLTLLNFIDDLERFLDSSCKENSDEKNILKKVINKLFSDLHISEIILDKYFNHEQSEALCFTNTANKEEDETICAVLRKGYKQNGTILRPAQVNVFKYKEEN